MEKLVNFLERFGVRADKIPWRRDKKLSNVRGNALSPSFWVFLRVTLVWNVLIKNRNLELDGKVGEEKS